MTKVLRILNRFNLGGPTYNAAYLTKYLEPDFETMIIGGKHEVSECNSAYILENLGITPIIIPEMHRSINIFKDYIAYKKIKKIIQEFQPDIVHTHASKAGMLGRYAAHRCKVPVIVYTFHGHIFHSYFNKYATAFFKFLERRLANYCDKIIAISNIQKHELADIHKIAKADKFAVIPLGFDLQRFQDNYDQKRQLFRQKYQIDEQSIVISIVGRLVPIKNHKLFIDAFTAVKNKTSKKIIALIVGDGELKQDLLTQAQNNGLLCSTLEIQIANPDIFFTSWIKEVDAVFAASDIACLTSSNEGTPVSLIEAQAANTAVVSTRTGGVEDIVIENETALLAESNNLEDFASKLLSLVEDDDLRQKFSQQSWNFVKNKFSYMRLCNDMKLLYNQLLTEKNKKNVKKHKFFFLN